MRITILTAGSQGDVQPYIALGLGLQTAGHDVYIATQTVYHALVRSHGLTPVCVGSDPREIFAGQEGQARLESVRDPVRFMSLFARSFRPFIHTLRLRMERLLADSWNACQGTEAIICSPTAKAGYHIAEKLGVPCFMAPLQPQSRTRAFPSLLVPAGLRLGGTFNWLTHIIFEQFFWQLFRQQFNQWRQETLGLSPLTFISPYGRQKKRQLSWKQLAGKQQLTGKWQGESSWKQHLTWGQESSSDVNLPFLYGYSPCVVPKPSDWPEWLYVTGYWFLDSPPEWQPPSALVDFLAEGPPPVYIGFGSLIDQNAKKVTEMALKVLTRTGHRGILQAGWTGLGETDLPDGVIRIEASPHDWLFPQMAAVVHHGGAGTVAAGLRAGVPSIITPAMADQPFWGQRVAALGVGPSPIPYRHLSVERLAAAIRIATSSRSIKERAAALGQRIQAEEGIARAVEAFHHHLHQYKH
jgi:sterol 3beta-glucosyltransferase